jgi:hypothetical protein
VYRHGTQIHPLDGWNHEEIAPGGRYTLQHQNNHVRIFAPAESASWEFSVRDNVSGGDATQDGRHALVWCGIQPSQALYKLMRQAPYLERIIGEPAFGYLMLYEYPGRCVAIWRPKLHTWWPQMDGISGQA